MAIAWSVVEHLHRAPDRGPRTLYARHYQELRQLEKHLPRLRVISVAVKEWNDEIVFVRRVMPGAAHRSYAIQVARLAGLPLKEIDRAKTILSKLESDETSGALPAPQAEPKKKITIARRCPFSAGSAGARRTKSIGSNTPSKPFAAISPIVRAWQSEK